MLSFLGLVTFQRALQASIDDTHFMLRINRIRRFYVEVQPQLVRYLVRPAPTDEVVDVLRTEGIVRPSTWQLMLSIVGALGVIDSVLFGVTAGLAVAALTDRSLWAATPVGLVVFTAAVPLHQRYQRSERHKAHESLAEMFPDA